MGDDTFMIFSGRPKVVCLCGSTRFDEAYDMANYEETKAGNIVLSVGSHGRWLHHNGIEHTDDDKIRLDVLHLRKIDMADEILVLNVGGYVGYSTKREIEYAKSTGKHIRYWESIATQE